MAKKKVLNYTDRDDIWKKNVSKHEKVIKQTSPSKMKDFYNSENFKKAEKSVNRESKIKQVDDQWKDISMDAALNSSLTSIEKKEMFRCRASFKILIVDDNPEMVDIISGFLKEECKFINIDKAYDGLDALDMCKKRRYDLILSDFTMPNMNGYKLYFKLNEMGFTGDFVMISGYSDGQFRNLKAAGVLCLPKSNGMKLLENIKKVGIGYYIRKLDREIRENV